MPKLRILITGLIIIVSATFWAGCSEKNHSSTESHSPEIKAKGQIEGGVEAADGL